MTTIKTPAIFNPSKPRRRRTKPKTSDKMKIQTATETQFIIRIPRGVVSGYSSRHDTVQTVNPSYPIAEWAKIFSTRKAAEKFIAKYDMANGFGPKELATIETL